MSELVNQTVVSDFKGAAGARRGRPRGHARHRAATAPRPEATRRPAARALRPRAAGRARRASAWAGPGRGPGAHAPVRAAPRPARASGGAARASGRAAPARGAWARNPREPASKVGHLAPERPGIPRAASPRAPVGRRAERAPRGRAQPRPGRRGRGQPRRPSSPPTGASSPHDATGRGARGHVVGHALSLGEEQPSSRRCGPWRCLPARAREHAKRQTGLAPGPPGAQSPRRRRPAQAASRIRAARCTRHPPRPLRRRRTAPR